MQRLNIVLLNFILVYYSTIIVIIFMINYNLAEPPMSPALDTKQIRLQSRSSHLNYPPPRISYNPAHSTRKHHIVLPPREISNWSTDVPQYSYAGQHSVSGGPAANIPDYFYNKGGPDAIQHSHYWNGGPANNG